MIRNIVGEEKYWTFPQEFLFNPTGMHSAIIEVDANGTFVGSSFGWMTARDWARFGQLFLNKGVWNGSQLLPEGWIKYTTTPASKAKGRYGAHWWLNDPKSRFPNKQPLPDCPSDTYFASGFAWLFWIMTVITVLGVVQFWRNSDNVLFRRNVIYLVWCTGLLLAAILQFTGIVG